MEGRLRDGGLLVLRLCLFVCVLVTGTAMVRNGTKMLRGLAHAAPVALAVQPVR